MATFPASGIELVVPSNAEREITGLSHTINFARRGYEYSVEFWRSGLSITRNGAKVRSWDDLPKNVQNIIRKSKDMLPPLAYA